MARQSKEVESRPFAEFNTGVADCTACALRVKSQAPIVGAGPIDADLMIVGVGPGRNEAVHRQPFVGAKHNVLAFALESACYPIDGVRLTNLVRCRSSYGRQPTREEIQTCSSHLRREIRLVAPDVIVALGPTATAVLYGQELKLDEVAGFRLAIFGGITLVPTYDPQDVVRGTVAVARAVRRDLATAVAVVERRTKSGAEVLEDVRRMRSRL